MATAIVTHYLGPTNHRGSRVVAQSHSKRNTVDWDHSLNLDENHARAADLLLTALQPAPFSFLQIRGEFCIARCDLPGGKGARVHVYSKI